MICHVWQLHSLSEVATAARVGKTSHQVRSYQGQGGRLSLHLRTPRPSPWTPLSLATITPIERAVLGPRSHPRTRTYLQFLTAVITGKKQRTGSFAVFKTLKKKKKKKKILRILSAQKAAGGSGYPALTTPSRAQRSGRRSYSVP